ncbi:hypothetical protein [Pseudonocardia sp. NPDC049635]|uniref:DUF6932 family protein n=1 Tax=Pseudonocardia sp. NPDC049635 TaxID=3155506 RepID=UPI0033F47C73
MLGNDGLLPPGRHQVTAEDVKRHFVDGFPEASPRRRLYARWLRHREALVSVIRVHSQWIDGSYVTSKVEPGDIDVVSLLDAPEFEALAPGLQHMVASLVGGKKTREHWMLDSYAVLIYPDGHALRSETDKGLAYWDKQWQGVRDNSQLKKGYLEVKPDGA